MQVLNNVEKCYMDTWREKWAWITMNLIHCIWYTRSETVQQIYSLLSEQMENKILVSLKYLDKPTHQTTCKTTSFGFNSGTEI